MHPRVVEKIRNLTFIPNPLVILTVYRQDLISIINYVNLIGQNYSSNQHDHSCN